MPPSAAHAADTAVAVYDSGWETDADAPAAGPIALEPIPSDFAGHTDRMVTAFSGGRSTLTYQPGDREAAAQGVLLPVGPDTDWDDIARVDADLLDALDAFTRPWLWEETCGQLLTAPAGCQDSDSRAAERSEPDSSGGCLSFGGSDKDPDEEGVGSRPGDDSGEVISTLGAYDAWLIQPASTDDALAWMADHGFTAPPGIDRALGPWIDGGGAFLALKLDLDVPDDGFGGPAPVRIRMGETVAPLPLGLGTLGGPLVRDLLVFTLDEDRPYQPMLGEPDGPGHCLLPVEFDPAADLAAAWKQASGIPDDPNRDRAADVAWAWEAWLPDGRCLDCRTYDQLADRVVEGLGLDAPEPAITRSRLRVHRGGLNETVYLGVPGFEPPLGVRRVVDYRWELAGILPHCDGTEEAGGGTCFGAAWWLDRATTDDRDVEPIPQEGGCGGGRAVLLLPLLLVALRRRP